jgi:Lsr2
MAQITEVRLLDDIDGGEAAESVAFSLDGKSYEIDLSEKHAAALRDAFAPFVSSARRAGGTAAARPRMSTRAGRPRAETAAIREWASANGLEVSARGRISSTVLEAYESRGNTTAAAAAPVVEPVVETAVEAEPKPKRRTRKKAAAEG